MILQCFDFDIDFWTAERMSGLYVTRSSNLQRFSSEMEEEDPKEEPADPASPGKKITIQRKV